MSPRYHSPTIESIIETGEENVREERERIAWSKSNNIMTSKSSSDTIRIHGKRSHKSSVGSSHRSARSSRHTSRRDAPDKGNLDEKKDRHRKRISRTSEESSSDDDDDDDAADGGEGDTEVIEDHRVVLAAARGRLASPSIFSMSTSLTTATDNSGGSSGSNSTVTQASVTRRSKAKNFDELPEEALSPAAPDPPDVFAYLISEDSPEDDNDDVDEEGDAPAEGEGDDENQCEDTQLTPMWPPAPEPHENYFDSPLIGTGERSLSSSTSSSFHGDSASEIHGDNETDRSTSPERSSSGSSPCSPRPSSAQLTAATFANEAPPTPVEVKFAAHEEAARQRQNLRIHQPYGSPRRSAHSQNQQRHQQPLSPSTALTPTRRHHMRHPSPREAPTEPALTEPRGQQRGYKLLASALTVAAPKSPVIPPIYRKFTALSHRYLLQLQDELAEHEEQLEQLDHYSTQILDIRTGEACLIPDRRRRNWDVDRHRAEILHVAGHKLKLYQEALKGLDSIEGEGGLRAPKEGQIERYRGFLEQEQPVVEEETRFLDHNEDLVVVGQKRSMQHHTKEKRVSFDKPPTLQAGVNFTGLAVAIATAVLVPILTFVVIPGFLGRITVAFLVAGGVMGAFIQSGSITGDILSRETVVCAAVYGVGMSLICCVMR